MTQWFCRGSKIKGTVQIQNFTTEPTVLLYDCVMFKRYGLQFFFSHYSSVANKTNLAVSVIID